MHCGLLESFHSFGDPESEANSSFAINGMDVHRIRDLVRNPPWQCGCEVDLKSVIKVCKAFWSLDKERQDSILWSLQSHAKPGSSWFIEGPSEHTYFWNTH